MFANIKNRFISVIAPEIPPLPITHEQQQMSRSNQHNRLAQQHLQDKFAYARPIFLQLLTHDELKASADHNVRPIIVPRDIGLLPWGTGYAECVNSGKSEWNEDQAAFGRHILSDPSHRHPDLPYTYFGIFDGHAGYGAALAASHQFHHILHEKLVDCTDVLLPRDDDHIEVSKSVNGFPHPNHFTRRVSKDELIIGALESAFFNMDALIAQDRNRYRDAGGCTACVSLFINGKLFVANAGDSRAVLCQRKTATTAKSIDGRHQKVPNDSLLNDRVYAVPFSFDHTPETEKQRLLGVARLQPHLLCKQYAAMEYSKRPHAKDLGQRILCRQGTMKGWTYKTLTLDDLRMPVVTGEGKRSRLLGTLGVTRGFGDHDLLAINTGIHIKPFLTPHPEVNHRDLTKIVSIPGENNEDGDFGVLIMGTDGLWDVSENEAVARTVFQTLAKYSVEKHRYTMVAQELVAKARGKINDSGHWRLADSKAAATVDDISVIVIPVYQYYKEHVEWEQKCAREFRERMEREAQLNAVAEMQVMHMNGLAAAAMKEDGTDGDDEEEEEGEKQEDVDNPVVELIQENREHTKIEMEQKHTEKDTSKDGKSCEQTAEATIAALEAIKITTSAEKDNSTNQQQQSTTPENKNKHQQQNKRKENR